MPSPYYFSGTTGSPLGTGTMASPYDTLDTGLAANAGAFANDDVLMFEKGSTYDMDTMPPVSAGQTRIGAVRIFIKGYGTGTLPMLRFTKQSNTGFYYNLTTGTDFFCQDILWRFNLDANTYTNTAQPGGLLSSTSGKVRAVNCGFEFNKTGTSNLAVVHNFQLFTNTTGTNNFSKCWFTSMGHAYGATARAQNIMISSATSGTTSCDSCYFFMPQNSSGSNWPSNFTNLSRCNVIFWLQWTTASGIMMGTVGALAKNFNDNNFIMLDFMNATTANTRNIFSIPPAGTTNQLYSIRNNLLASISSGNSNVTAYQDVVNPLVNLFANLWINFTSATITFGYAAADVFQTVTTNFNKIFNTTLLDYTTLTGAGSAAAFSKLSDTYVSGVNYNFDLLPNNNINAGAINKVPQDNPQQSNIRNSTTTATVGAEFWPANLPVVADVRSGTVYNYGANTGTLVSTGGSTSFDRRMVNKALGYP